MPETKTLTHQWVKHVITPVETLDDGQGEPVVMVDPDQQDIAEDNAAYGCINCNEPMATAFGKPCEGAEE